MNNSNWQLKPQLKRTERLKTLSGFKHYVLATQNVGNYVEN